MALTSTTDTTSMTEVVVQRVRTRYHWPPWALNFWIFIMLVGSSTILGINAYFITVQEQLMIGIPWYFTYWIVTASLTIIYVLLMLYLISKRQLLPGIVIIGAFMLFILWLTGLIVYSIRLWGDNGVSSNCNLYIGSHGVKGVSVDALAWLEQRSICQSWTASWVFELIGTVWLVWMMAMSYQVYQSNN